MKQNSSASDQCGQPEHLRPIAIPRSQIPQASTVQRYDKPENRREPYQTSFHQSLYIIVVRGIHEEVRIEAPELWIDGRECAEAPPESRFMPEHSQPISKDGQPHPVL